MAQIDFLGDPIFQGIDSNGVPISGGLIWCYDAGTDNLRNMYPTITDAINQTNPLANPFTLDSAGRGSIVYAGVSKFKLENNDIDPDTGHGTLIWTADNVGRFGNTIIDPNGNLIVEYDYVSNAVNYIDIENAAAGNSPIIEFTGADTNVGGVIKLKNNGRLQIVSPNGSYFIPNADGASGYLLTTDGAGNATWQPAPGVAQSIPAGFIMEYGVSPAPAGWLICDGSAVSRATYAALFAAIGTTWGPGDGVNTFNVPDLRRRTTVGSGGTGTSTLGNAVANVGGAETVTLTTAQIPGHTHGYNIRNITSANVAGGGNFLAYSGSSDIGSTTASTGGGGSHNNIQPSAIVMKCIKT